MMIRLAYRGVRSRAQYFNATRDLLDKGGQFLALAIDTTQSTHNSDSRRQVGCRGRTARNTQKTLKTISQHATRC